MGIPKSLDYKDFMNKSTSANPTTWDDMYRFFGNQGEITAALVKSLLYQPSTAYSIGAIVYSPNLPAGTIAKCTLAGTTGSTEPAWPAAGSAVNDGTVMWLVENMKVTAAQDLTPYMKKDADSDLVMGDYRLIFPGAKVSSEIVNSVPMLVIDTTKGSRGVAFKGPDVLVNGSPIATETDLSGKLDKTGTAAAATKATQDGAGNVIATTYIKTVNNVKPDRAGNVNISTSGGGSNITVDTTLDSTSSNAIANKAVYAALNNKLDKNGTAMYASRDSSGNIIKDTYAEKSEVRGVVKSVNNIAPDSNGNVTISVSGGGGGSGDYLPLTGGTVTGGITATNFQTGTGAANYFQCRKFRGEGNANSYYHAIDFGYSGHDSVDFYEYDPNWNFYKCLTGTKSGAVLVGNINGNGWNGGAQLTGEPTAPTAPVGTNTTQIATTEFVQAAIPTNVSSFTNDAGYIKSVNNIKPDSNGNVNISTSSGGGGGVSTSVQNTWTAQQSFDLALLTVDKYKTTYANGNSVKPSSVTAVYNATGSFTLDLTNFSYLLSIGQSLVFTAYIKANADYPLTITNGGTLKYIGSPSDLAITSAGLLLNIFITLDNSGNQTSIVQASKLS